MLLSSNFNSSYFGRSGLFDAPLLPAFANATGPHRLGSDESVQRIT